MAADQSLLLVPYTGTTDKRSPPRRWLCTLTTSHPTMAGNASIIGKFPENKQVACAALVTIARHYVCIMCDRLDLCCELAQSG